LSRRKMTTLLCSISYIPMIWNTEGRNFIYGLLLKLLSE
jgi:hypothetical protein